jgi:hypothetical protein
MSDRELTGEDLLKRLRGWDDGGHASPLMKAAGDEIESLLSVIEDLEFATGVKANQAVWQSGMIRGLKEDWST